VRVHGRVGRGVLAERDGRLRVRTRSPRDQLLRLQVDDGLVKLVRAAVVDVRERSAGELLAGGPRGCVLRRLVELHEREQRSRRELLALLDHVERREDLVRGQRVEWVGGGSGGGRRRRAASADERRRPHEPGRDEYRQRSEYAGCETCSPLG